MINILIDNPLLTKEQIQEKLKRNLVSKTFFVRSEVNKRAKALRLEPGTFPQHDIPRMLDWIEEFDKKYTITSKIEIIKEVMEEWKNHENYEVISKSIIPYESAVLSGCSPHVFKEHAEEIASRLSKISISSTREEIKELMLPGTAAENTKITNYENISRVDDTWHVVRSLHEKYGIVYEQEA